MAADGPAPGGEAEHQDGFLLDELVDRLDTLRLLREGDPQRADVMLEQFGAAGRVESQMLAELGQRRSLQVPDRFPDRKSVV